MTDDRCFFRYTVNAERKTWRRSANLSNFSYLQLFNETIPI